MQVIRLDDHRHWLILAMNHCATDQMSIIIMLRDLAAFYNAITQGSKAELPLLPMQVSDHMAWLSEQQQSGPFAVKQAWWQEKIHAPDSGTHVAIADGGFRAREHH